MNGIEQEQRAARAREHLAKHDAEIERKLRAPKARKKMSLLSKFFVAIALMVFLANLFVKDPPPTGTSVSVSQSYEHDLTGRCKDRIYFRNRAYKLGREGDQAGAEEARRAMVQFRNDLRKIYSADVIATEISRLEASGYNVGF